MVLDFVCSRAYLVDPGGDCILCVVWQLLEKFLAVQRFSRRVPVDAGHHPLYAHHLHCVRHHQGINESQMGTLQKKDGINKLEL